MDANIKSLWLAALRGGEYKQGIGTLRDGDAYCCLGVLCDVLYQHNLAPANASIDPTVDDWNVSTSRMEVRYVGSGYDDLEYDDLPERMADDLGLAGATSTLMDMNDGRGKFLDNAKSFAEIADYIEANL